MSAPAAPQDAGPEIGTTGGIVPTQGGEWWNKPAAGAAQPSDPVARAKQARQDADTAYAGQVNERDPFRNSFEALPALPAANYRTAVSQADQEYRQQQVDQRRSDIADRAAFNSKMLAQYKSSGQQYYTDPETGRLTPVLEEGTKRPLFHKTGWQQGEGPDGKPTLQMRDQYGQRQFKAAPIVAGVDPSDEQMYYRMPDGTTTPAGKIDDFINHPNYNIAKAARSAKTAHLKAVHQQALEPMKEVAGQMSDQYQQGQNQRDELSTQLAQATAARDNSTGNQPMVDGYNATITQLQQQIDGLNASLKPGGQLHMQKDRASRQYDIARRQAVLEIYKSQNDEIAARLKQEGRDPATDPTIKANMGMMNAVQESLGQAQQSAQASEAQHAGAAQAIAQPDAPAGDPLLGQSEPVNAIKQGVKSIGGVGIQEFAKRYGSGAGPVDPASLIKLYQRSKAIEQTLGNSDTGIRPDLKKNLTDEKSYIDNLAKQRMARLDPAKQQQVSDATRDASFWETIKGVGKTAAEEAATGGGAILKGVQTLADQGSLPTVDEGGVRDPQAAAINKANAALTPSEKFEQTKSGPAYQLGSFVQDAAKEFYAKGEYEKQHDVLNAIAGSAGGFAPLVASGPGAPLTIGLQTVGSDLQSNYDRLIQSGATPDKAADVATKRALLSGALQSAIFEFLPKPLQKAGNKYIVDKIAGGALKKFLANRAAQGAEGAVLGGTSKVAENVVSGQPAGEGVAEAAGGMALAQGVMPREASPKSVAEGAALKEKMAAKLKPNTGAASTPAPEAAPVAPTEPFTPNGAPSTAAEAATTLAPELKEKENVPPPSKSAAESAAAMQAAESDQAHDQSIQSAKEGRVQSLIDEISGGDDSIRQKLLSARKDRNLTTEQFQEVLEGMSDYKRHPEHDPADVARDVAAEVKKALNKPVGGDTAGVEQAGRIVPAELEAQAKVRSDAATEKAAAGHAGVTPEEVKDRRAAQNMAGPGGAETPGVEKADSLPEDAQAAARDAATRREKENAARASAIDQQLTETERLRQSPAGGEKLKADLKHKAAPPVEFLGRQEGIGKQPGFNLYNLTEDIPGHPKGSSVGPETLAKAGYDISKLPTEKPAKPTEDKSNAAPTGQEPSENIAQHPRTPPGSAVPENVGQVREKKGAKAVGGDRAVAGAEKPASRATEGNGSVREVKLSPKEAAPISADVAPHTAESVEGKKIDKNWTAFDKESGTLGVPRAEMPQVKSEARGALVNFLKARGIEAKAGMISPSKLKPTQAEFNPEKVQAAREHTGSERPILISSDGHVVDGHHQWIAALDDPTTPMPVIRLNAPIDKVLADMKEFPSTETAKGAEAPKTEKPVAPSSKPLSERAIEALQKAKLHKPGTLYESTAGLLVAAHDAALDVAILGIRAGRAVADVVKLAVARFKAKYPGATPEDISKLEGVIRDAHAEVNGPPPESPKAKSAPTPKGVDEAAPETTGIAHRVSEVRGSAAERGEGISAADSVEHGRELLKGGFDADKAIADFNAKKSISADVMAGLRAKAEQMSKATNRAADAHGTDSPEYKAAWEAEKAMIDRIKPLQTEWHKIGQAQQGETEIDTGTFHGMQKAFYEATGKDMDEKQADTARKLSGKVKGATDAADAAQSKLLDEVDTGGSATERSIRAAEEKIGAVKPGAKWTPDQAKALWHLAKANYLDKGVNDFNDIRAGLATDYGLTKAAVAEGLASPRGARVLTDAMYAKMAERRRVTNLAKQWLAEAKYPGWYNTAKAVPGFFFNLATFGHGTVGMITHAGNQMFDPTALGDYWGNFGKQFRLVGSSAAHERMMQDLVRDPNFITAKRAGLANDPFKYQDDYQNAAVVKMFKGIGLAGNRGFDALKMFRQDRFNRRWDGLPASLKTPEMAKMLADLGNHETGVTRSSVGRVPGSWLLFAPKLEASRWAFLAGDPARAAKTFANWKNETPEARNSAMMEVKQKALIAGTYLGALAINQGLLKAGGSDEDINFTNPRRSDWLSFKVAGHNVGIISPMVGSVRFLANVVHDAIQDRSKFEEMQSSRFQEAAKDAGQYVRGKLSPFAKVAADTAFQADFRDRPMPWSKDKISFRAKSQGVTTPYSYGEYAAKNFTPIPVQEAVGEIWKSQGMAENQVSTYLRALAIAGVVGGTGARVTEDTSTLPKPPKTHGAHKH